MTYLKIRTFAWSVVLLLSSYCHPTQKSEEPLSSIVTRKIGKNHIIKNNLSNTYALCYETNSGDQHISKSMRFLVIKLSNKQIVIEDLFKLNQVQWENDTQVSYFPTGGEAETFKQEKKIITVSKYEN